MKMQNLILEANYFRWKIQSMQTEDIDDLKNEEVILYCRSGNRSGIAAMTLDSMGFTNTKNLTGGMLAWEQKFK